MEDLIHTNIFRKKYRFVEFILLHDNWKIFCTINEEIKTHKLFSRDVITLLHSSERNKNLRTINLIVYHLRTIAPSIAFRCNYLDSLNYFKF